MNQLEPWGKLCEILNQMNEITVANEIFPRKSLLKTLEFHSRWIYSQWLESVYLLGVWSYAIHQKIDEFCWNSVKMCTPWRQVTYCWCCCLKWLTPPLWPPYLSKLTRGSMGSDFYYSVLRGVLHDQGGKQTMLLEDTNNLLEEDGFFGAAANIETWSGGYFLKLTFITAATKLILLWLMGHGLKACGNFKGFIIFPLLLGVIYVHSWSGIKITGVEKKTWKRITKFTQKKDYFDNISLVIEKNFR